MSEYERGTEVVYHGPREEHYGKSMTVLFQQGDTFVLQYGKTIHDSIYKVPSTDFRVV